METSAFREILNALQTGGPWTLVLITGWAVRYLYQGREVDREKHDDIKQKLNDRLIAMAEKQNEVLEKASLNQALILEAVQKIQQRALASPGSTSDGFGAR